MNIHVPGKGFFFLGCRGWKSGLQRAGSIKRREVARAWLMAASKLSFGDVPGQECSPVASQGQGPPQGSAQPVSEQQQQQSYSEEFAVAAMRRD